MSKFIDLTGQRFGRLTVVRRDANNKSGHPKWLCKCDCGNTTVVNGYCLRSYNTQSCSCYQKEQTRKSNTKNKTIHGETKTRLYTIWNNIIQRTNNLNNTHYFNYGGRGITVCDEWKSDFLVFKTWALSNGYSTDLTIDRIDNDKGYSSDNCRWTTRKEQNNNTRNNCCVTHNGETRTLSEWSEEYNVDRRVIKKRINRGWSIERALTEPVKKQITVDKSG